MLVVDASVAIQAAGSGVRPFESEELVAPPLMWAEARSVLHEATWRGDVSRQDAEAALADLHALPIRSRSPRRLGGEAWRIADQLGWAKTYDAEYLALAKLLECRLVTIDLRLRRGAGRLGFVVLPNEL